MNAQLIDRIYESCFAPETWPDVLDEIGRIGDTTGASLIGFKKQRPALGRFSRASRASKKVRQGRLVMARADHCEIVFTAHPWIFDRR
jgi:hypothetical protein